MELHQLANYVNSRRSKNEKYSLLHNVKPLAAIGLDIGYQLIPDQKIAGKPYRWDEPVALHPIDLTKIPFTDNYYAAALIFDLALSIAISDGSLTR